MKKLLNFFIFLTLLIALLAIGYFIRLHLQKGEQRTVRSIVPKGALFRFETEDLASSWHATTENSIWKNMARAPYWNLLDQTFRQLRSKAGSRDVMDLFLDQRPMLASAHLVSGQAYGYLFVVDLQNNGTRERVGKAMNFDEFKTSHRSYKNIRIEEVQNFRPNEKLYYAFIDNLLALSQSPQIIERAIAQSRTPEWDIEQETPLIQVVNGAPKPAFRLYVNFRTIGQLAGAYLNSKEPLFELLSQQVNRAQFDLNLRENRIEAHGIAQLDSLPSYLHAVAQVRPASTEVHRILSNQVATMATFSFQSFAQFQQSLQAEHTRTKSSSFAELLSKQQTMEKYLGINLQKDLYQWVSREITLAKLRPSPQYRVDDILLAVRATSIDSAKLGLNHILTQMQSRAPNTPIQLESYRDFPMYHFPSSGFFKIFFGSLFPKLDAAYFTYIDDFVVFSNSETALAENIDHYLANFTLGEEPRYLKFWSRFSPNSALRIYVQSPKIYPGLYHHSTTATRKMLKTNKHLLEEFAQLGLQGTPEAGQLHIQLQVEQDSLAIGHDEHQIDAITADQKARKQLKNTPSL